MKNFKIFVIFIIIGVVFVLSGCRSLEPVATIPVSTEKPVDLKPAEGETPDNPFPLDTGSQDYYLNKDKRFNEKIKMIGLERGERLEEILKQHPLLEKPGESQEYVVVKFHISIVKVNEGEGHRLGYFKLVCNDGSIVDAEYRYSLIEEEFNVVDFYSIVINEPGEYDAYAMYKIEKGQEKCLQYWGGDSAELITYYAFS